MPNVQPAAAARSEPDESTGRGDWQSVAEVTGSSIRVPTSRGHRGRRRWLIIIGSATAFLLLTELFVRARDSALPDHQIWVGPEMQIKQHQIDTLHRRGGTSIMILGSSTTDIAIDPSGIAIPVGSRPAYNASTGAGSLAMIAGWARLFAVPRLKPDVVVLGVVSRDMNANDPQQIQLQREFFSSPAVHHFEHKESFLEVLERRLEGWSAVFRYRTILRQPKYILQLLGLRKSINTKTYGEIVAPSGQYQAVLRAPYQDTPAVAKLLQANAFHNFEIGPSQQQTLRDLLAFLHARTRRLIVISMPVTADYVAGHPHGAADYDRFVGMLRGEAQLIGATFVDAGVWPRDLFIDPAHVNQSGSRRLTAMVNQVLHASGAR